MPKLYHFTIAALALIVVMVAAMAVAVTGHIAQSTIALPDPLPFLIWVFAWYLFLVLAAWFMDRAEV